MTKTDFDTQPDTSASTAPTGGEWFTAIGFWDDSETVQVAGIVPGNVDVIGGDVVSEGGPWAEAFLVPDSEDPEDYILSNLPKNEEPPVACCGWPIRTLGLRLFPTVDSIS